MTAPKATDAPVIVTFDGTQYKVPPSDSWPSDALEVMFDGNLPRAMRMICGDDVYAKFNKKHPSLGELKAFMELMGEQAGTGN